MPKKSDKDTGMTWPIFGGLELFYENKPVFESLIQKSKYKDPHRCGVYIDATYYSTNLFYNLQEEFPKGLYVTTFDVENSWFMVELTKGHAMINGYKLQKMEDHFMCSYVIKVTDNIKKDEKDWITLPVDDNKEKLVIQMKFNVYYPAKIIKIIQTGKCTKSNVSKKL